MKLFNTPDDDQKNLLPYDGMVHYFGRIVEPVVADRFLQILMSTIAWKNDEAFLFGKHIITQRKVAWYGEKSFEYTYSNSTKRALPWTPQLLELKRLVERKTNETFNSCLLNLYHSGEEGMAWHSDGEKDLKKDGCIASVSFGAERKFSFKHKNTRVSCSLILEHGSLLIMKGNTQTHWLHRLPPSKKKMGPRVNLTFRTITEQG